MALPKIIQLLKPDDSDNKMCATVLRALSVFSRRSEIEFSRCICTEITTIGECIHAITAAVPGIIYIFAETKEEDCRKAAAQVLSALARRGLPSSTRLHFRNS